MSEQRTLSSVVYDSKRKVTRRERFLQEMDAVIPWAQLEALVAPHYRDTSRQDAERSHQRKSDQGKPKDRRFA